MSTAGSESADAQLAAPAGGRTGAGVSRGRAAMLTKRRLALVAILLVGVAYATMIQSFSWNQASHYDLIRSMNQDQTTIDAYQQNTGDKVLYKRHYYSARAPGLALFALPFYDALNLVNAESLTRAHVAPPNHPGDEMIYLIGLWANVMPGLLLLLLVWQVSERFEPGYGVAAAVVLGLGTMVLPLSTLLFSHVFTAFLGFSAFGLMLRERDGPPSAMLLGLAGVAMGYARSPLSTRCSSSRSCSACICSRGAMRSRRCWWCVAPAPTSSAGSSASSRSCSTTTTPSTRGPTSPTPTSLASRKASSGSEHRA